MKNRIAILTLVLVALGATAFVVYAAPQHAGRGFGAHRIGGMHPGFGFMEHLGRLKEELDLTDAQVDQIKAIMKQTHEQNAQYREQMHGGFVSVAQRLVANPNDIAGAQSVIEQQSAAERALKTNLVIAASKALNVLTPEQRTKLADHLAERAARWENRGR